MMNDQSSQITPGVTSDGIIDFIGRWESSGAAERANYQLFLCQLCDLLDVGQPEPSKADPSRNAYVFEHPVLFDDGVGHTTTKFVDLYKKGCFILEAKQGSDKIAESDATGLKLPKKGRRGTAIRGTQGWDDAMLAARGQAELYAKALPITEGWPPFLVIVDVGHSIELYADFSRSGKTYVAFPDALTHRIPLKDVAKVEIRGRLRDVWIDPLSLDPSKKSAKVTREVAEKLADLAKSLERSGHEPEVVAHFLMRSIFTMFAEDVGLLPKDSFRTLLEGRRGKLETFPDMVGSLWTAMDRGEFSPILERKLLRFNGQLFADPHALMITEAQLELLIDAVKADWKAVEPAIFGTLLERALDPIERHKLGAHYTPRAYVERIVIPTIIDPLREEWSAVQTAAVTLAKVNKLEEAREEVHAFLNKLCDTKVLDPACGSGNYLYVTLEHMKRLEGEVRDTLRGFGERQEVFEGVGLTVDPHQLLGIELNPRAAAIAELVLWIGYLQWHFRTFGSQMPAEPVIKAFKNIECRDAVLAYDRTELEHDESGRPVTRWDGRTMKKHPVTGENIPDETAFTISQRYINPSRAEWPKTDYVIGNPPFIGTRRMRLTLGDGYVEALTKAMPNVPENADYVMYWWDQAAELLRKGSLKQFGLITTNSITQSFNRATLRRHLTAKDRLSIVFGIPDHPWVDSSDGADVRIAMTVAAAGEKEGERFVLTSERYGSDFEAQVTLSCTRGLIAEDLRIGASPAAAVTLRANANIAYWGVKFYGDGFILTPEVADLLASGAGGSLARPFVSGRDLTGRHRGLMAIDCDGLTEDNLRDQYPHFYQYLLERVKPVREHNPRAFKRERWWIFGENQPGMRRAIGHIDRFIATTETSKHRVFHFFPRHVLAEGTVAVIALDDAYFLGVLSSRTHVVWALAAGGRLGVGNDPRYNKTRCFDNFPFPDCSVVHKQQIRELAEALDSHRKSRQAEHSSLTTTELYNVLEKIRSGSPLSVAEKETHEQGLTSVLKQIHDDLDAAVFAAYGWQSSLSDDEILTRLVVLNAERAAEEAQGVIRWLRPELQNPSGHRAATQTTLIDETTEELISAPPKKAKTPWPKTLPERAQAVRTALAAQRTPVTPEQLAKTFLRANVDKVEELLDTLASLGQARELSDGRFVSPLGNLGKAQAVGAAEHK